MEYNWINNVAKLSDDQVCITFNNKFNEIIKPNSLPKFLTILIFGGEFNQLIISNSLPENLTNLVFGFKRDPNQKIEPNSLFESLTNFTFDS